MPIVVIPKKDGSVRVCSDYKVNVNRCILPEEYPLLKTMDLFATLAGGKVFSKRDLSFAYQQLPLDLESEQYLTVDTHKVFFFRYHCLAYDVSTALAVFQHTMDRILKAIDNVVCFMDDILVSASTEEAHLAVLDQMMARVEKHGLRMKLAKCAFQDSVEYLGYRIDEQGLHPTEDKVEAIINVPAPRNISELRSFLGLLNYHVISCNITAPSAPAYASRHKMELVTKL